MNILGVFLESLSLEGALETLLTVLIVILAFFVVIYVYMSLAFMKIGRRAGLSSPGVAWIPGLGPMIIAFRASGMHWWPWLLYIPLILTEFLSRGNYYSVFGILYIISFVAFYLFVIIWNWKMFEKVGRPGWWAIVSYLFSLVAFPAILISPIVGFVLIGLGILTSLVLLGIAAWGSGGADHSKGHAQHPPVQHHPVHQGKR